MSEPPPWAADPDAFRRSLGWLESAWEFSPASVGVTVGPRHVLVYQNAASRALFGARRVGIPLDEAFPDSSLSSRLELDEALATGRPVLRERRPVGVRDFDGRELQMQYVVTPYGPPGQPALGLVVAGVNLTGEAQAELASNRSRLLARLTERISTAADAEAALRMLTDLLVPELADIAAVFVLPEIRDHHELHVGRRAPEVLAISPALEHLGPPPLSIRRRQSATEWEQLLAAGQPVLLPLDGPVRSEILPDDAVRAWMAAAGARNLAVIPMVVAGRLVGALVLIAADGREPYSEQILPFLTDIAARAGVAVGQVRQHQRQLQVSQQLQQALLPTAPPSIPGLRVSARYQAGASEVDVGGDWWDVARVDERHLAIGVGDVSGRGVEAAIMMGQARAAMRTASLAGLPPGQVLQLLDRQLSELVSGALSAGDHCPQFATALYGVLDLATDRAVIANAGHLPLLLKRPGEASRVTGIQPGPPLGLAQGDYPEGEVAVPPGSSLLIFTDGLVEDRDRDLDAGLAELAELLDQFAGPDPEVALGRILAAARGGGQSRAADDVAAVLVHRPA